ncbi:MAG: polysaccharide biosynthesis/export family protein [Bacteroidota bacterium]
MTKRMKRVVSLKMSMMAALALLLVSCVPNRKIAYLQYGDELNNAASLPIDSLVRMYETGYFQYRLQPDDQVDIKISTTTPDEFNPFLLADRTMSTGENTNFSQSALVGFRIDPFGYLHLPVIGKLQAGGMTLFELQDTLDHMVSAELEDPVTKVNLINFRFSVLGEVEGEGMYRSTDYSLSLLQAMSMAGGISEFGDLSRVKVIRKSGDMNLVFYVNLLDESFLSSSFYFVQPNDVIIVSPMKNRLLVKNVPQTLGLITSTLSLVLMVITLISVNGK